MFLLKLKQLQSGYHTSNHLIRCELPARLNDRLETFFHAISLFLHKVFIELAQVCLQFCVRAYESTEVCFSPVSSFCISLLAQWHSSLASWRAILRDVWIRCYLGFFFKSFVRRSCLKWGRTVLSKCPVSIARVQDPLQIRLCFLQKVQDTCAPSGHPCRWMRACCPAHRWASFGLRGRGHRGQACCSKTLRPRHP